MKVDMNVLKQLRADTKASFGECRKALIESAGDLDAAKEILRKRGAAKAAKKADRETSEGGVKVYADGGRSYMVTLFCETDFVAKNEGFQSLLDKVYEILKKQSADALSYDELSDDIRVEVDALLQENVLVLGENIKCGPLHVKTGESYAYNHAGNKLASIVYYEGGDVEVMKEVALQVAAMNPSYVSFDDIPAEQVDKVAAEARESLVDAGKPADMIEKIVEGKVKKELGELVLMEQSYIRDGSKKIKDILAGASLNAFERFTVG